MGRMLNGSQEQSNRQDTELTGIASLHQTLTILRRSLEEIALGKNLCRHPSELIV